MRKNRTRIMVECGLMVAAATVLSYIPIFRMPWGGSVTLCSMMPLVVGSFRHGPKWGVATGAVNGLIQMLLTFENVMYCTTIWAMAGCILLDYVLAFSAMGTACVFGKGIANRAWRIGVGTLAAGFLRYLCSFLSGILIWGGYAPEGTPVWIYSLLYNASYMAPEVVITAAAAIPLLRVLERRTAVQG